jgi:hypothetical protein
VRVEQARVVEISVALPTVERAFVTRLRRSIAIQAAGARSRDLGPRRRSKSRA